MQTFMQFFGQDGRTARFRFLVALLLFLAVLAACVYALGELSTAYYPLVWSVIGFALGRLWGEAARRLHDVGLSSWVLVMVAPAVVCIALSLLLLFLTGTAGLVIGGLALAGCAWLFLRPGRIHPNPYGAAPQGMFGVGRGPSPVRWTRGAAWLCGTVAAGAAFGLWIASISDGIREQNERRAREFGAASSAPAPESNAS